MEVGSAGESSKAQWALTEDWGIYTVHTFFLPRLQCMSALMVRRLPASFLIYANFDLTFLPYLKHKTFWEHNGAGSADLQMTTREGSHGIIE